MKHALIVSHPELSSFTRSMAHVYDKAARALGHETIFRDLYQIGFDPCLKAGERPDKLQDPVRDDVRRERELLADCDVFALFYPIWFGTPPAMLKGYIERVFNVGFAFERFKDGQMRPLLQGRKLISFTASGSSKAWLEETGVWLSLRALFDDYLAKIFGLEVVDHVHFSSIADGLEERWIMENLETVQRTVREGFVPAGAA